MIYVKSPCKTTYFSAINSYDPNKVSEKLCELYADPQVQDTKGICEYILGGCKDTKLLKIRVFDDTTKRVVYEEYKLYLHLHVDFVELT